MADGTTHFSYNGTTTSAFGVVARVAEQEGTVEDFMGGYLCEQWEYERELRYRGTLDQVLANVGFAGLTVEVRKLDGSTFTFTFDNHLKMVA